MTPIYKINRACLQWNRPRLFNFLNTRVFPNLANLTAPFPGAAALVTIIKNKKTQYENEKGLHHTETANQIYEKMKEAISDLMAYIESAAGNDNGLMEQTGFYVSIPPGHGSVEPLTGQVTNVKLTATGEGRFMAEFEADHYAHEFFGETKLHFAPDEDYKYAAHSQHHTMYFTGYAHAADIDVRIYGSGTKGDGVKSDVKTVLVN